MMLFMYNTYAEQWVKRQIIMTISLDPSTYLLYHNNAPQISLGNTTIHIFRITLVAKKWQIGATYQT